MKRRLSPALVLSAAAVLGVTWVIVSFARAVPPGVTLVDVGGGQTPPDTGLDGKTIPEIVDTRPDLGAKALKVAFAPGDSIGGRAGKNSDWTKFTAFRFDAVNPADAPVVLSLTVVHDRSKTYQTRVVVPITLNPGKTSVRLPINTLANVNGSAPDLAHVQRWYLADADQKGPTVFFGPLWLEAAAGTTAGKPAKVSGDPARVARIRAASMPKIVRPISYDTPEADAIVAALEVFPADNPWNLVVSDWPLHPDSDKIVRSVGAGKVFRYNPDMTYILVPPTQPRVEVKIVAYPSESDPGPFPVPPDVPIEGWPANYRRNPKLLSTTLDQLQRDTLKEDGDRHASVLDPVNRVLYEFYQLKKTDAGWQAAQSSVFDLKSNKLRPDTWTSTDAAGLPIFPSIVRYDELRRGEIEHALRFTVTRSRKSYVYPATHHAGHGTADSLPRMGERFRLKKDVDLAGFSPAVRTILTALKKYGMFVADNGLDWSISVAPDMRIPDIHEELRKIKGADFEVVQPPPGYQPAD